jgi:PAS domain S-box-containing protein
MQAPLLPLAAAGRNLSDFTSLVSVGLWEFDSATGMVWRDMKTRELIGNPDVPEFTTVDVMIERDVHPSDRETVRLGFAAAIAPEGTGSLRIVHRLQTDDDSQRWIEIRARAVGTGEGPARTVRLSGVSFEVTRLIAEARLAESNANFRILADSMPQMVWSTLPDGHHDYFNARWYAFTGTEIGQTNGGSWNGMFHPDDRERAWARWSHSLATGDLYEIEYRLRRFDGEYRWTLGRAAPIRDDAGNITRWFGTCTDIDDQKRAADVLGRSNEVLEKLVIERSAELLHEVEGKRAAEKALHHSEKLQALGLLTGGIVHDINNILQILTSGLHLLEMDAAPADKKKSIFGQMRRSIDNAQTLIARMLSAVRAPPIRPDAIHLDAWLGEMSGLLGQTLGRNIAIVNELGADLWPVAADPSHLEAAVLNLAVNARDAMPIGGRLKFHATNTLLDAASGRNAGKYVQLSVSDTGSGMSSSVLARAFEPFFTTKDKGKGTGLGLAQIYGFAKQSGGDVEVASVAGAGTTVTLYLPAHGHAEATS